MLRNTAAEGTIGHAIRAPHKAGAASIPEPPFRAASIPNMFGHVVEAHTT